MAVASTEQISSDLRGMDTWSNLDILKALVVGQEHAISAVRKALPEISQAAELLAENLRAGGRLFYAGAGTSIRIGVQDGSELPATFGMDEKKIGYLIAGGKAAIFETLADAEDDAAEGARAGATLKPKDTLIAIAASGKTPYTLAVARAGKAHGASVISVTNNADSALSETADLEVYLASGSEMVAGSTRMGAGTAQKAALNLISTLAHIKLGAIYDGMMVSVRAENSKLRERAKGIVQNIAGVEAAQAAAALDEAKGDVKLAVLRSLGAASVVEGRRLLEAAGGNLRAALAKLEQNIQQ
jgi:N-acetylmuramic acid 6-phosphate etherase